jgi:8-oxo-dGTP pyrophosphatase MutT (NUDIX family)
MSIINYIVNVRVAVWHEGKYLMMRRSMDKKHMPGRVDIPGGKVENANNKVSTQRHILEATGKREVWEETGITTHDDLHYLYSNSFVVGEWHVVDIVFFATYASGDPIITQPEEVSEIMWLTPTEIYTHPDCEPWTVLSIKEAEKYRLQASIQ